HVRLDVARGHLEVGDGRCARRDRMGELPVPRLHRGAGRRVPERVVLLLRDRRRQLLPDPHRGPAADVRAAAARVAPAAPGPAAAAAADGRGPGPARDRHPRRRRPAGARARPGAGPRWGRRCRRRRRWRRRWRRWRRRRWRWVSPGPARRDDQGVTVQSNGHRSPLPLDPDPRSLEPHERIRPGQGVGATAVGAWGGPVGEHAVVGRQRFWTPLRVVMLFTVLFLAFGFFSKAACLETSNPTDGSQPGLQWDGRQYYKACYADPLPLYSTEGLADGALPYKYMWVTDSGEVRYMEYPVVSGLFQYVTAQGAQAWDAVAPGGPIEVVKYFVLGVVILAFFWMI